MDISGSAAIVATNILYLPISNSAVKQIKSEDVKEELIDLEKLPPEVGITYFEGLRPLLLLKAASQAGLVNYGWEWWHYSYGDRAWAYVKGEKQAKYGLAVNKDDPILSINKESYLKEF